MPEREGLGRRQQDTECANHDDRLTMIEEEHAKQAGYIKSMTVIVGVLTLIAIPLVSWFCSSLLSKLSNIEAMLGKNDVMVARMDVTVQNHEQRIKDIEARHNFIDQSSYKKGLK